jgi:hypothetical protein
MRSLRPGTVSNGAVNRGAVNNGAAYNGAVCNGLSRLGQTIDGNRRAVYIPGGI